MSLSITIAAVATMLLYAIPGYGLVKFGKVKAEHIPNFAVLLLYICSPCLSINSFSRVEFTPQLGKDLILFFILSFVIQFGVLLVAYALLRKKGKEDVRYRIYSIAVTLSNCAFMGVPLMEALLPEYPAAVACSAVYSFAMNTLAWTVGSYIISGEDKQYISPKKILFNPCTVVLPLSLFLFISNYELPAFLGDAIGAMGRVSTTLCMLIMGMRLATSDLKKVFTSLDTYVVTFLKQMLIPGACMLLMALLPLPREMQVSMYILLCCPVASMVLSFAEMIGKGQRSAADLMLASTILSIVTIPIMMLLV